MKQTLLKFTLSWVLSLIAAFSLEAQVFLMDGTAVSSCSGFFMDSGGIDSNYSANESLVTTLCGDSNNNTNIKLRFSGIDLASGDRLCFYDGADTLAPLIACYDEFSKNLPFIIQASATNPSGCITVAFVSNDTLEGQGWNASIDCFGRCQNIQAILTESNPLLSPADTGWIDVCPGESILLKGMGQYPENGTLYEHSDLSSSFQWDFGDGTQALGPEVQHQYEKSGGYTIQLTITDQLGCTSTNFINQRVRVAASPRFMETPDANASYCLGDTIQLLAQLDSLNNEADLSIIPTIVSFQSSSIRSDSLPLPDGDGTAYESSVFIAGFTPGQLLTDVTDIEGICLNMEHSWLRDLEITLFCPSGDSVILHDHIGKTGSEVFLGEPNDGDDNLLVPGKGFDYCWNANAANPSWLDFSNQNQVGTLPEGQYQAAQSLDQLLGCPLNGEWKIKVKDLWVEDNGIIFSWGIDFARELYPELETFRPDIISSGWSPSSTIIEQTSTNLTALPIRSGSNSYRFFVEDDFGCTHDTTLQVEMLPSNQLYCLLRDTLEQGPLLSDTTICRGGALQLDVTIEYPDTTMITFESIPDYEIGNSNHPHNNPYRSGIQVENIFPDTLNNPEAQIVSVCVDLETDWASDIHLFLQAPDGTLMELSTDNGSDGDDYANTCFTPKAMDSIQAGQAPFSGSFIPEGSWSVFENTPINGEWNLIVSDGSGQNELGRLISWSITLNTQNEIRYEWVPNQNISCNDCSMPIFSPTDTTAYTLILSDNYGQEYRDTFLLNVSPQPCSFQECTLIGQVLEVIPPSCSSSIDGQLMLTAGGGQGPYEFRINGSLITGDTVTFTSLPAGDQLLTITDQASCTDTLMVNIPLPADALRLNLLVDQELSCVDAQDGILLGNVQGGQSPYQFDWQGLSSTTNSAENVGAGTYFLRVRDNNGCVVEDTVELVAPLPLVLDFDVQQPRCSNTQDGVLTVLPLGGEGPYSYQWRDGQTTEQISMLGNGQYLVIVTDSRGCEQTATAELMAPTGLQIDSIIANPVNCFGGSSGSAQVVASGGTGKYLYQWDDANGQVDSIATGLRSGTYNVSVVDENGCELTSDIIVPEPAPLAIELTPTDVQCKGIADGSVRTMVSGGTMPYQYNWSNQQNTPDLQNLNSGNYRLTVTDANGCQIQGVVMVAEPSVGLSLTIDQVKQGCNGKKSNSARVNTSGSNGPFTYLWSDGQNTPLATGLDSLKYTVQVTDVSGCFSIDSIKIQDLEPLVPNIIISPPSCRGTASGALGINFVEGGSNAPLEDFTFVWSNGATGPFVDGLIGGETYVVTVTDPAGCQATASRTVTPGQGIRYDAVVTPVRCFEERNGKIELTNLQGQGSDYLIRWDVVSGGSGTAAGNLAAGSYSFTITDEANCSQEATIRVPQPAPILINFNTQDIDCFSNTGGGITALIQGGTGSYQYLWSNQDTTASIGDLSAGTYTLSVTDQNGCQQERSATINQPSSFETRFTTKMPTCQGDRNGSITVAVEGGSPPYQFSLDNQNFQPGNVFLGLFAGTYTVFIKDRNGCTLFQTVTLEDPAPLEIQASPKNAKIRIGESIQLQANNINGAGNIQFYWKVPYEGTLSCQACPNPISTPQNTITYELAGTDENGCTASDFLSIFVQKPKVILVPTGFTPNNDGLNDGLIVHGEAETLIRRFQVFDRWGSLIFEAVNFLANDEENAWNGRYKNQEAGNGVYLWVVEAEFVDGSTEVFKGQTSLIR